MSLFRLCFALGEDESRNDEEDLHPDPAEVRNAVQLGKFDQASARTTCVSARIHAHDESIMETAYKKLRKEA